MMTFVLAMLKNREAQRQAQIEIDSVLGHERLPTFSDLSDLPYLSAVVKEVLRYVLLCDFLILPRTLTQRESSVGIPLDLWEFLMQPLTRTCMMDTTFQRIAW